MFPDSFIVLTITGFVLGLLNSANIGQKLQLPGHRTVNPQILDVSLALLPTVIARIGVGSGMSVVLTGLASLIGFQFADWNEPHSRLRRYTPIAVTLAFLSPLTLTAVAAAWWLLGKLKTSESLNIFMTGIVLIPVIWLLHHRDLYVLFGFACLIIILYNESPYFRWKAIRNCPAYGTSEPYSVPPKAALLRRLTGIGIVLALGIFLFANRYVYRGFGLQQELFRVGNRELPFIALTFDDGPDPLYTPFILDILTEKEVPATFFLIGRHAEAYPELVKRIALEGHLIGNHTYNHRNLYGLDEENTRKEIFQAHDIISNTIGSPIHLFRPPRGMYSQSTLEFAHELQYTTVLWSISSRDWAEVSSGSVARNILRNTQGGDILLFHDSGSIIGTSGGYRYNTVNALPLIIDGLRSQGFIFVTVDQLIMISGLTEGDHDLLPDILPELPDILGDPPFTKE
ncbi:MAG: polysaccharide deacetylase family protein [Firmicutes bacterium]|nr:polysaccharide deacetylase family protein [Bacillota bacterium]